jgi:hydroxyacylglutathione hydrolase
MLAAFAGWLLQPDDCLMLVADNASDAEQAAYELARIGYDQIAGFLAPSLTSWAAHG